MNDRTGLAQRVRLVKNSEDIFTEYTDFLSILVVARANSENRGRSESRESVSSSSHDNYRHSFNYERYLYNREKKTNISSNVSFIFFVGRCQIADDINIE